MTEAYTNPGSLPDAAHKANSIEVNPSIDPVFPDNVQVHVFLSSHQLDTIPTDYLSALIASADVIIPEEADWDAQRSAQINAISAGEEGALHDAPGTEASSLAAWYTQELAGSGKPVLYMDSEDPELRSKLIKAKQIVEHGSEDMVADSFNGTMRNLHEAIMERSELEAVREAGMVQSVAQRLQALLLNSPELATKPKVNVLVLAGLYHTTLFHSLRKAHTVGGEQLTVTRSIGLKPELKDRFRFFGADVIDRAARFDKKIPKRALEQLLGDQYMYLLTGDLTHHTNKEARQAHRKLVSKLKT